MALLELTIRRIALIDELTIEWGSGLSAITGETGAGKSIVIGAVAFLLGERADREMLQTGASRGGVTALFDISALPAVQETLRARELDAEDGQLILSRELFSNGRTVCRVAGETLPLSAFRNITAQLVELHGQHANQALLDSKTHLAFLDAFGDAAHIERLSELRSAWRAWRKDVRALDELLSDAQERARRLDMLRYQLAELKEARLVEDEEIRLESESRRARHAEKIDQALRKASALVSGTERTSGALNELRQAAALLGGIAGFDESFASLSARLATAGYELEDVASELSRAEDEAQIDPRDIDRVESRLALLQRLGRKYGASTREMLAFQSRVEKELEETLGSEEHAEQLRASCARREETYRKAAQAVSETRRELAEKFASRLRGQLQDLSMERARFEVAFADAEDAREDGVDHVMFVLSANPGEPLRPLSDVASGGELSRVMLALKTIEADRSGVPVMIFDEIDTGISGRAAQAVAEKMAWLARSAQVICVTHLPQIAAMADIAYLVSKQTDGERTRTMLERLDEEARADELARMLGGASTDEVESTAGNARAYAKALLLSSAARKRALIRDNVFDT